MIKVIVIFVVILMAGIVYPDPKILISQSRIHFAFDSLRHNYLFDQSDITERHFVLSMHAKCILDSIENDFRNGLSPLCNYEKLNIFIESDISFQQLSSLAKSLFYPEFLNVHYNRDQISARINWYGDMTYRIGPQSRISNYSFIKGKMIDITECKYKRSKGKTGNLIITAIVPDELMISKLFSEIRSVIQETPFIFLLISRSYAIENYHYYQECFVHPKEVMDSSHSIPCSGKTIGDKKDRR